MSELKISNAVQIRTFSVVEITIVLLLIAILAAIALPQFANSGEEARAASAQTTLANIRIQLEIFKAQHDEKSPAVAGFWPLMTGKSDTGEANSANPTGKNLGPYLLAIPTNPWNNRTAVSSATVDPNAGWYYSPTLMQGYTFCVRNPDGSINADY